MVLLLAAACTEPEPPNPFHTTTPSTVVREPALVFDGPAPRNVLMISVDTTRRDQFGPYSVTGVDYTPFLTSLATSGVVLADFQQCSNWTFASTSCTLNGRYPEENGFVPTLTRPIDSPDNWLPDGQRSLAVRLGEQGWYPILVSSNGWLGVGNNNAQGYAEFEQATVTRASSVLESGITRLRSAIAAGHDRWMLHLHFIEPHPPYNPPAEYLDEEAALPPLADGIDLTNQDGQYAAADQWPDLTPAQQANLEAHLWARYHGELRYLDDQIAAAWPELEADGLLDDTLVVLWTDHGEQFWEHGDQSHAYGLTAEENDAVAFFWANDLRAREWTEPAHAVDLAPTVLEAVGLPPGDDPWFSGDVLGLGRVHRARYASADARRGLEEAVTLEGWKLVYTFSGKLHLYDRTTDRYEAVDRLREHPDDPHLGPLWDLLLPRALMLQALRPDHPLTWPEGLPHG